MSAALQLSAIWAAGIAETAFEIQRKERERRKFEKKNEADGAEKDLPENLAFYRKHTENLLRRYLYASVQVGRAPSILSEPVGRGWASSRPVRSFEDAVIFVLDVELCLSRLQPVDRHLLSRLLLQEYTQQETAAMLGMCVRTVSSRYAKALDRLTKQLLATELLVIPD